MTSRMASRRVCAALRAQRISYTPTRFASAASTVKGSSLPQDVLDSIAVSVHLFYCSQFTRLTLRSAILPCPPPIRLPARRPPASSTSNYRTWSRPTCVHRPCSRREKDATCGMLRIGDTSTSPLVSLSMPWAIVTLVWRKSLENRYYTDIPYVLAVD